MQKTEKPTTETKPIANDVSASFKAALLAVTF